MDELAVIVARLRAAIATQSWAEARGLLPEYRRALDAALRGAAPAAAGLLAEARELFGWGRTMALASREQAASRLQELERTAPYRAVRIRRSRWELEG